MARKTNKWDIARFFGFSLSVTIASLVGILFGQGWAAALTMFILIAIEITFSFENAIINARVLERMSRFWQQIFLTIGILIAIFGMRVVFPILIVTLTAGIGWREVIDLVLNHPDEYAARLHEAHYSIASFGGAFLLMLALYFFFDDTRTVHWFGRLEKRLQRFERNWLPVFVSIMVIWVISLISGEKHGSEILNAGIFGIATFVAIQMFTRLFEKLHNKTEETLVPGESPVEHPEKQAAPKNTAVKLTGLAAFSSFMYLEVLDASFSFDGVIGAFAVTSSVLLIALGLGVGAVWVRSLTVFMVRKGTLDHYKYLEHGAHYTVVVLAATLLLSVLFPLPEAIAGVAGFLFIGGSYWSSRRALLAGEQAKHPTAG